MTETLFAFDTRNYRECQKSFRGERNQEYYLGDYSIEAGSVIDVRAEKKAVGCCSIIRLRSRTRLFFRRALSHIRQDATDVTVLWFVKRGSLSVSHQAGCSSAAAGDFIVTNSMTPFTMECHTDEESVHEVFHVVVPTHDFRRIFGCDLVTGFSVPAQAREFGIAERMLIDVFESADELAGHTEQLLVESAFRVLAAALERRPECARTRQSLADLRLQGVLRFIELHLSDPRLSTRMVTESCAISPRYLSYLLKQSGTSFSALVWDKRLEVARGWLCAATPHGMSIAEIAFRVGFKSPAHFSRMFKRVFGKGPREYRTACQGEVAGRHAEYFVAGKVDTIQ